MILDSATSDLYQKIQKSACFTTVMEKQPKFLSVGKISFRVHVGITTMLEKQPKFLSVGKILSFRVHVGITTVLEKQPKFLSVGKISFQVHVGIF